MTIYCPGQTYREYLDRFAISEDKKQLPLQYEIEHDIQRFYAEVDVIRERFRENPHSIKYKEICAAFHEQIRKTYRLPLKSKAEKIEVFRCFANELIQWAGNIEQFCTPFECQKMKGDGAEQYFCASHDKTRPCTAIDYISHTLDSTIMYLHSRTISTESDKKTDDALKTSTRRLHRIFLHLYHVHNKEFIELERSSMLCFRFESVMSEIGFLRENISTTKSDYENIVLYSE